MSRVFWDTNLFVYLLEGDANFGEMTSALRRRMIERKDVLVTSAMTLGEVEAGPRRAGQYETGKRYREMLLRTCTVVAFEDRAAAVYAQIRENAAIKPPDAIQLSCAAVAGVELFITNDKNLHKLSIPGIHFIAPLTRVPI